MSKKNEGIVKNDSEKKETVSSKLKNNFMKLKQQKEAKQAETLDPSKILTLNFDPTKKCGEAKEHLTDIYKFNFDKYGQLRSNCICGFDYETCEVSFNLAVATKEEKELIEELKTRQ